MKSKEHVPHRHPVSVRASHWLFAAAFVALTVTGLLMLLRHSHLFGLNAEIVHRYFVWPMLAAGAVYLLGGVLRGDLRRMLVRAADLRQMAPMAQYYLGRRTVPPPYEHYNPLQKAAYAGVLFFLAPVVVITGYALWPHVHGAHAIATLLGGRGHVKLVHVGAMVAMLAFLAGHLAMVTLTGWRRNVRAMIFGLPAAQRAAEAVPARELVGSASRR